MAELAKRDGDTPRSYAALLDYAAMGAGRSLAKLAAAYRNHTGVGTAPPTRQESTLGAWSASHAWAERVAAYDAVCAAEGEAERAARRRQRRAALEEADHADGAALRAFVMDALREAPKFLRRSEQIVEANGERVKVITLALAAGPGELARALKEASALQRLSLGEATEIHRMVETELEAALDRLAHTLDEETFARVLGALAGDAGAAPPRR